MMFSVYYERFGDSSTLLCIDMPDETKVPRVGDVMWLTESEEVPLREFEVKTVAHDWRNLSEPKVMITVSDPMTRR